jgi:hypothetical protein
MEEEVVTPEGRIKWMAAVEEGSIAKTRTTTVLGMSRSDVGG